MSITVEGIINPRSTQVIDSFTIYTYYESTDDTLVAVGTIAGVQATTVTANPSVARLLVGNVGNAVPGGCTGDCATCSVIATNCTSCISGNLLNNQCLNPCPAGYAAVNKVCQPCEGNCKTC